MKKVQIILSILLFAFLYSCNDDVLDPTLGDDISMVNSEKKRTCGTHEHTSKLMNDPIFKEHYNKRMVQFNKVNAIKREKAQCSNPGIIPVAIHYQGANTNQKACLIALAQDQIQILNDDYAGTNSDINKWSNQAANSFPGVSNGEVCLKFVIANTNHPSGFGLQNGDLAVTINQTSGDQSNSWSGYLNIFVQPNTGLLGYAPFGGSGNGDGVVVDAAAFGMGNGCGVVSPDAPFNLGRTLTHEVGHYFLLDHIWGNGCNQDDEVADTPDQSSDYNGCPNVGASSCGSTDMHMNYMDYTNDACMYMFSNGQATRMENYVTANLSNLINNASNVINGTDNGGGDNGNDGGSDNGDNGDDDSNPNPEVCEAPQTSTVITLDNSRVRINWDDIPNASRYRVRYREVGTSKWNRKGATKSHRTLTKLRTGVLYEYRLRTKCPDGWTKWGPKTRFQISGTDDQDDSISKSYTLELTLDDWGSETTWYILDENFNEIQKGGPYQDGQAGQVVKKQMDLTKGCYELELQDAYGDGICCEYGNGSARILNAQGQEIVKLDGNFGTFDYVGFCVDGDGLRVEDLNRDIKLKSLKKK